MKKYESMKTSELLDLLPDAPDEELDNILSKIKTRSPFGYYYEMIDELESKVELLESKFKRHIHSEGKIYIELK